MAWPANFPKYCPPEDASSQSHLVYRIVYNNPPQLSDFESHTIRFPHKAWGTPEAECRACGISVYLNHDSAAKKLSRFEGCVIAKGNMNPSVGVSKKTGSRDHYTWWIYLGSKPNFQDFVVVT